MKTSCRLFALIAAIPLISVAEVALNGMQLEKQMNLLWDYCIQTYRSEKTGLFYGRPVKDLAPAGSYISIERYRRGDYPTRPYRQGDENTVGYNLHGGGAGAEDCSLFTGTLLGAMCDKFQATGSPECAEQARMAWKGIRSAALAHGEPGFIARGVCHEDGKSIFAGTSRDQYTNAVYGMWRFYNSPLSSEKERAEIRAILTAVAEKMYREITPERNYSFSFAYGVPDDRGVAKMYDPVHKYLALRLAMIYAAAGNVTGEKKWRDLCDRYLDGSLEGMVQWTENVKKKPSSSPHYVVLQQGYALELLHKTAATPEQRKKIEKTAAIVSEFVEHAPHFDIDRTNVRGASEIICGLLKTPGGYSLTPKAQTKLRLMIQLLGPRGKGYPGSNFNLIAAYWAARAKGFSASEPEKSQPLVFLPGRNGYRAVETGSVAVKKGSALDLSALNHTPAGKYGRLIITPAGDFAFERNPAPFRLMGMSGRLPPEVWGPNVPEEKFQKLVGPLAEAAANQGYNLFRMNGFDEWIMRGAKKDLEPNPRMLDRFDRILAELKKHGIYLQLSLFTFGLYSAPPEYARVFKERDMHKLMMYLGRKEERERFRRSAELILNHINPYTGMAWKDDPAVAVVEFYNEQDLGFSRMENVLKNYPEASRLFYRHWRNYLNKRYQKLPRNKWPEILQRTGIEQAPVPNPYSRNIPELLGDFGEFYRQCVMECNRFYIETMKRIGYRGVVVCNARPTFAGGRAQWETLPAVDQHAYYVHPSNWVAPGSFVGQASSITGRAGTLRYLAGCRLLGRPFLVGEYNHCFWNPYQYEQPLCMAAYAAFQNFNALSIHENPVLLTLPDRGFSGEATPFFVGNSPVLRAGEFLGAMFFRRQDVTSARHWTALRVSGNFYRQRDNADATMSGMQTQIALLTGFGTIHEDVACFPGTVSAPEADLSVMPSGSADVVAHDWFTQVGDGNAGNFSIAEFSKILRKKGILPSGNRTNPALGIFENETGEILLETGETRISVSTPRTEAVAMKGNKRIKLRYMDIEKNTRNALIGLTSIDNLNLENSARMILVYATRVANSGMELEAGGKIMRSPGKSPILLQTGQMTVRIKNNSRQLRCYALSLNGERREELPLERTETGWSLSVDTAKLSFCPAVFFELTEQ